jgi:hypothetical protein
MEPEGDIYCLRSHHSAPLRLNSLFYKTFHPVNQRGVTPAKR